MKYLGCWLSITILLQLISRSFAAPTSLKIRNGQLLSAIRTGNLEQMQDIILETPDMIEKFEANFWIMALKSFTFNPNEERYLILENLWEGLANKNENQNGLTPLFCSVYFGNRWAVRLVLGKSDIDAVDQNGNTALIEAIRLGFIGIAEILIENGADVNIVNFEKETALHVACRLEDPVTRELGMKLLLENCAEVFLLYKPYQLKISRTEMKKFKNLHKKILKRLNEEIYDDVSDVDYKWFENKSKLKLEYIRNYNMDQILIMRLIMANKMTEEFFKMGLAALATIFFASVSAYTFH